MKSRTLRRITRRLRTTPTRDARRTRKDLALARRLYRTFEHDLELARVRGIHFYVKEGEVTLYGAIRHELDRALLVSLTGQIEGVEKVIEHLQVVEEPFRETPPEITLKL